MLTELLRPRRWRGTAIIVIAAAFDLWVYSGDRELRGGGLAPEWLVPTLTVLVFATLYLRWRHPAPVFAVTWTLGLAGLALPNYAPIAGMFVALHAVGRQVTTRLSVALLALAAVPLTINNVNIITEPGAPPDVRGSVVTLVWLTVAWSLIASAIWAVGRISYRSARRAVLLQEAQAAEAAEAVRAERLRLARDLHDIVAHAVNAMILQAAGARAHLRPGDGRVQEALADIETAGVQAMQELHRLLGLLRAVEPDLDEDTTPQPGLADIPALIKTSRTAGLDVESDVEGTPGTLDRSVELAAYRTVQEAVTNAMKHGGVGTHLRLRQTWDDNRLTITARSNPGLTGRTAPLPSSGVGLRGLAERVGLVGGQLDAGRTGDGFLLRAELPRRRSGGSPPT